MKKLYALCLAVVMVVGLCTVSFAAELGGFVSSPSKNQAPDLVESENETEGCTAQVIITSYADRHSLDEEGRIALEEAYADIINSPDLSVLAEDLADIAKELGVQNEALVVSDLFDITITNCEPHDPHGNVTVTLDSETFANFACLMRYSNGAWTVVENAKLDEEGNLVFSAKEFDAFAVVVQSEGAAPAKTPFPWIWIIIAAAVLATVGAIASIEHNKRKKNTANNASAV